RLRQRGLLLVRRRDAQVSATRRSPLRGRMCSVRLRVLVLVTLMLTLAACASSQTSGPPRTTVPSTTTTAPLNGDVISTTAVDLSATPTDWVPVADGDVQISVPTTWRVLYHSS